MRFQLNTTKQKINLNYLLLGNLANQALREQQSYVMVKSALSKAASDSQLRIISC